MALPSATWAYSPFEGARLVTPVSTTRPSGCLRLMMVTDGGRFPLHTGGVLSRVEIAYETYGELLQPIYDG